MMAQTLAFDDPDAETYANACSVLHSITFGTLNRTDYDVRRSAVGWGFSECIPYCLSLLGYTLDDLDRVNPIQITATKGKGSTAAFTAAILQHIGKHTDGRPVRVGRLTGPYFVTHRDQIAINGLPVSEELFSRYFWRFWNKLREAETPDRPESYRKPSYLFFIFCLAMIIFIEEGVDVAVIEVFCGGRSDCTSMIPRPLVVSVGSIGLDHVRSLGGSEEAISYEKSGLYKPGCNAVTIRQKRANWNAIIAKEAQVAQVDTLTVLAAPFPEVQKLSLGISGNKSALNASLAITIIQAFLSHPRRPTAFTTTGRALRAPKDKHKDMAHSSLSEPSSDRSIRGYLARMVPSSEASTYACLALAVLAAVPLFLQEVQNLFNLPWARHLPYMLNIEHHTIFYIQLALFLSLASIRGYNSYSPKSAWKNPLLLDPPLPSLKVSKHLVSSATVARAIQSVRFPGRGDIVPDTKVKGLNWLMEAAHTPCSMPVQAVWASSVWSQQPEAQRVLLVMVEPYRPARKMFDAFLQATPESSQGKQPFQHVIFMSDVVYANAYQYDPDLKLLDDLEAAWAGACQALRLPRTEQTHKLGTTEEAADLTRKLAEACGGPMYALTFSLWPGDLHLAARLPVDFGQNCIITPK